MKLCMTILFLTLSNISISQSSDSIQKKLKNTSQINTSQTNIANNQNKSNISYKPEIFTSGFIDIINNGQVNASARFKMIK